MVNETHHSYFTFKLAAHVRPFLKVTFVDNLDSHLESGVNVKGQLDLACINSQFIDHRNCSYFSSIPVEPVPSVFPNMKGPTRWTSPMLVSS